MPCDEEMEVVVNSRESERAAVRSFCLGAEAEALLEEAEEEDEDVADDDEEVKVVCFFDFGFD